MTTLDASRLQDREHQALNDIIWAMSESLERDELLRLVLQRTLPVVGADAGEIFLTKPGSDQVTWLMHAGDAAEAFTERHYFRIGEGIVGRAVEGNVATFFDFGDSTAVLRPAVPAAGFKRLAAVPLIAKGRTWGVLSLAARDATRLPQAQRPFLEAIGRQVGLALAIADAYSHERRLTERLEGVNAAASLIAGARVVDDALREIVEQAVRLTGARYGAIGVHHPDGLLRRFISSGIDDETARRIGDPPVGRGLLGALRGHPVIRLRDLTDDPRFRGFPPHHPSMHTFLGVGIRDQDRAIGRIYLAEKEGGGEFTDEDEAAVVELARHAAVAIENATLYENLSRQTRYLEAVYDVGKRVTSSLDLNEVLDSVIDGAIATVGADAAFVYLVEPGLPMLRCAAARGFGKATLLNTLVGQNEGVLGRVSADSLPLFIADIEQDPEHLDRILRPDEFHSVLLTPIRGRGGGHGVMGVGYRHVETPSVSAQQAVYALADLAAIAIENSRSAEQTRSLAVLRDRERIAMDIHDTTLQEIFAAGLRIEFAADRIDESPADARELLGSVMERLDQLNRSIRAYIGQLSGAEEQNAEGLTTSLIAAIRQIDDTLDAQTRLDVEFADYPQLPPEDVEQIILIVREALANAHHHADAKEVSVTMRPGANELLIAIQDDGKGFDPATARRQGHYGLKNMQDRAARIGAAVTIESTPGTGTRVSMTLPLATGS